MNAISMICVKAATTIEDNVNSSLLVVLVRPYLREEFMVFLLEQTAHRRRHRRQGQEDVVVVLISGSQHNE